MRILFLGDIIGSTGREAVVRHVPVLREKLALDFVIVNGENAAHGFGITAKICQELYDAGVDCISTGNHIWDQREIIGYIERDHKLLRPVNFPKGTPGRGYTLLERDGLRLLVINAMARLFMDAIDDPFKAVDELLEQHHLGRDVDAIFVDFHGEATSEKMAMGHFCDGRASAVVGTHSHVPTADTHILPGGTAYQTDAGMCGSYDSVIGMEKHISIERFVRKVPGEKMRPAEGEATVCGVFVETDTKSGLARNIAPVRVGGVLSQAEGT